MAAEELGSAEAVPEAKEAEPGVRFEWIGRARRRGMHHE